MPCCSCRADAARGSESHLASQQDRSVESSGSDCPDITRQRCQSCSSEKENQESCACHCYMGDVGSSFRKTDRRPERAFERHLSLVQEADLAPIPGTSGLSDEGSFVLESIELNPEDHSVCETPSCGKKSKKKQRRHKSHHSLGLDLVAYDASQVDQLPQHCSSTGSLVEGSGIRHKKKKKKKHKLAKSPSSTEEAESSSTLTEIDKEPAIEWIEGESSPVGPSQSKDVPKKKKSKRRKEVESSEAVNSLLSFAQSSEELIEDFLSSHVLECQTRPWVNPKYGFGAMEYERPDLYWRIQRRLQMPSCQLAELIQFLCSRFRDHFDISKSVIGQVQRMEDATDFIIEQFSRSRDS